MKPLLFVTSVILLTQGCLHSTESEITLNPSVREDREYARAYRDASAQFEVIKNFETRFTIAATMLSADFRSAFGKRYQRLLGTEPPELGGSSKKTAFLVSLYTANPELMDLRDNDLWSLSYDSQGQVFVPESINRLRRKERWQPHFSAVNPWTAEYLVVFPAPPPAKSEQLTRQGVASFTARSSDGQVRMSLPRSEVSL